MNFDEKSVFLQALTLPETLRDSFLAQYCPDDQARDRIRTLLNHHRNASDSFLHVSVTGEQDTINDPTEIEEFKIIRRLGRGGMSVVYLAKDTVLGRHVALKLLAHNQVGSQDAAAHLHREACAAAGLKHPAIVPVHKFGFSGQDFYLVSEFVEGPTLKDVIAQKTDAIQSVRTVDLRKWYKSAAEVVATIADALECAHRSKIVHRDVKPSNVLMDPLHGPRLTDFGIAKNLASDEQTQNTALVGTCAYMSPEQAGFAGAELDQRSDIFSLGVVLYEMLALRQPFGGASMHEVLTAVITHDPPALRSLNRRIPIDLQTICQKALEKLPKDRYQSAAHVAADLRSFLVGDPILARPPSFRRRAWRTVRQHRNKFSIGAAVGLLLSGITIVWQYQEYERSRHCMVHLTAPSPKARIVVQQMDRATHEPAHVQDLGIGPKDVSLPPGQYRFLAVESPQRFSEVSVFFAKPGVEVAHELPSPAASDSFEGMVRFDGGPTVLGENNPKKLNVERIVDLEPFWIDATEVSVAEYKEFLDATGHPPPVKWDEVVNNPDLYDRPISRVSWFDANAYCRFVGKRLPTANEWECAMRYPDDRLLPWGDELPEALRIIVEGYRQRDRDLASDDEFDEYLACTHPVRSFPTLCTPDGLFHGATNVAEMTESIQQGATAGFVIKGASFKERRFRETSAKIYLMPLHSTAPTGEAFDATAARVGIRCARSDRAKTEE